MSEIVNLLPSYELQTRDNIPVVTYSLGNTIRNKVLNCQYNSSASQHKNHRHILTETLTNLVHIQVKELREPWTIISKKLHKRDKKNRSGCCIEKLCDNNKFKISEFKL